MREGAMNICPSFCYNEYFTENFVKLLLHQSKSVRFNEIFSKTCFQPIALWYDLLLLSLLLCSLFLKSFS